jgi:hypothetical protein
MRTLLITSLIILTVGLHPGSAHAQDEAPVQLVVRYAEVPFQDGEDAAAFLRDLADNVEIPEDARQVVNLVHLPPDGGEFAKEFSNPKYYTVDGQDLLGTLQFTIEAQANPLASGMWALANLHIQVGEEAPFLVRQTRPSPGGGDGGEFFTQRTRSVGFMISLSRTVLSPGKETVVHAEVNTTGNDPVSRIVTAGIYLQGE